VTRERSPGGVTADPDTFKCASPAARQSQAQAAGQHHLLAAVPGRAVGLLQPVALAEPVPRWPDRVADVRAGRGGAAAARCRPRAARRAPGIRAGLGVLSALAVRAPGRQWLRGQGRVPVRVEGPAWTMRRSGPFAVTSSRLRRTWRDGDHLVVALVSRPGGP